MSDREDLLRVDATGTVHPVGRTASQQLRSRSGDWRIEPSPPDLLVLRRDVSEGDAAPPSSAAVPSSPAVSMPPVPPVASRVLKLAGEIRTPGALCDVVALVAQSNWHGELIVIEENGSRSLFFDQGNLVSATTTVASERLGETLYRFGVITREQLDAAVEQAVAKKKRVGEAAIELEFVTAEELYPMMARQAEEVFYGALHVGEGMFYFFDRYDEKVLLRRHNLNAGGLLMEGARRMDEMRFFREKVPNENYVPVPVARDKKPPEDLAEVYAQCDGKRSIAEIGRRTGQLEFEVTRAIFQLTSGGWLQMMAPRPRGPEAIVEAFNPGLAEIHRQCDAYKKGTDLREGLSRFATGGGVYDPLFQGAGPLEDGTFKPERVAKNLGALAGEDPDAWLMQLLHEYVGFALFHAGSLLPREVEQELVNTVTEVLKPVRASEGGPTSKREMGALGELDMGGMTLSGLGSFAEAARKEALAGGPGGSNAPAASTAVEGTTPPSKTRPSTRPTAPPMTPDTDGPVLEVTEASTLDESDFVEEDFGDPDLRDEAEGGEGEKDVASRRTGAVRQGG